MPYSFEWRSPNDRNTGRMLRYFRWVILFMMVGISSLWFIHPSGWSFAVTPAVPADRSANTQEVPPLEKPKNFEDCQKLFQQGFWKETYEGLESLLFDSKTRPELQDTAPLSMAISSLLQLNRSDESDVFLDRVLERYSDDWLARTCVVTQMLRQSTQICRVGEKYYRGKWVDGGEWFSTVRRDRVRSLQILRETFPLLEKDSTPARAAYYQTLATVLRWNTPDWKLQLLTDLDTLPDYDPMQYAGNGENRGTPVDEAGEPIYYAAVKRFEDAKNDGERWRWCLTQIAEIDAKQLGVTQLEWASFLASQFGVQTLNLFGYGMLGNVSQDAQNQSAKFQLETLQDNETIAKLANGIRRFELPVEYNYLQILKNVAAMEQSEAGSAKGDAMLQLGREYENRRQYGRAVEWYDTIIQAKWADANAANLTNDQRLLTSLKPNAEMRKAEIVGERAMVEILSPGKRTEFLGTRSDGTPNPVRFALSFRNATSVQFSAKKVDLDAMLRDMEKETDALAARPAPQKNENRPPVEWPLFQTILDMQNTRQLTNYIAKEPTVEWNETVVPAADYHDRRIVLDAPITEPGLYWLACKPASGAEQYTLFWVDEVVFVQQTIQNGYLFSVNRADSGAPIANVECHFYGVFSENGNRTLKVQQFTETTDENGTLVVPAEKFPDGFRWIISARDSKDGRLLALSSTDTYPNWMRNQNNSSLYNQTNCYMMTDRPVYRPAQTAHYKFWIRQATYGAMDDTQFAKQTYRLWITNPKGEKVIDTDVTTDAYGGIEGEYVIPADAPLGLWNYSILDRGTENYRWGGQLFRIEEYKKPEYEVTVDLPSDAVRLGEKIEATISAKYYFGSPVTEAKVKYKVTRTATQSSWYPTWRWDWLYGSGCWWFASDYSWYPGWKNWGYARPMNSMGTIIYGSRYFGQTPPEIVLENEVDIGADGTVKIEIDSSIAKELFPGTDHRYEISAEVVDASRRTIVGNGSIIASEKPFTVTGWTDRGYYDQGDTAQVHFAARTANGKPVVGKAKITLYSVDYTAANPPVDASNPDISDAATLPVKETPVEIWDSTTNDEGELIQSFVAAASGQYRVACEVTSERGEAVEGGYLFSVFDGKGSPNKENPVGVDSTGAGVEKDSQGKLEPNHSEKYRFSGIELLTDKREYAPGETVQLRVATNRENSFVMLYIRSNGIVHQTPQFLRIEGRSAVVPIEIKAEDMPNFFVHAITIADGQIHEEVREICVPPVKKVVDVRIKPSKTAYKPGEKATVELELRDPNGQPMTGPVVVTIYDKSVEYISGGSQIPDIKEFFWKWKRYFSYQGYRWTRRDLYPSIATVLPLDPQKQPRYLSPLGGMFSLNAQWAGMDFPLDHSVSFGQVRGGRRMAGGMGGGMMSRALGAPMAPVNGVTGGVAMDAVAEMAAAPMPAPMAEAPMKGMAFSEKSMTQSSEQGMNASYGVDSKGDNRSDKPLVEATVRKSFADTALWTGSLMASNDGTAEVTLDMPENLTTWKIRVWGMNHETSCGEGTAEVITRKDLILRMQTPRFLVQTDEVVLTANVHNYLSTEKEVTVSLELAGTRDDANRQILEMMTEGQNAGTPTQVVKIPPQGESQINWRVKSLDEGEAVVRMKVLTDEESDAMEMSVPCQIHGMLKREAISGVVAPDAANGVMRFTVPAERRAEQTRLVVNVSPTIAASMIDALPYLIEYPYGCTEQTLNRFLPAAIVQKTLQGMGLDLESVQTATNNLNTQQLGNAKERAAQRANPAEDARMRGAWRTSPNTSPVFSTDEMRKIVNTGVERLVEMQLSDGGWGWFSGWGEHASAHTTATAVRGLLIARRSDVTIAPDVLQRGLQWLVNSQNEELEKLRRGDTVRRLREEGKDEEASKITDYRLTTNALDVLVWMVILEGEKDGLLPGDAAANTVANTAMSDYIFRDRVSLPVYAQAMSGLGYELRGESDRLAVVLRGLEQNLVQDEENQTAYLDLGPDCYWWCWYGSHFEAQAYYLKLLVRTAPKGETTRRVVKYLLNHRRGGTYWNSTRDTALCVEAFGEFLKASGETQVTTTVDVRLDGKSVKTIEFTPETLFTTDNTYTIEGADLTDGEHTIELVKTGSGPLYYHGYLDNFTLEDRITRAGLEVKIDRIYWKLERLEDATEVVAGGRGQVVSIGVEKYTRKRIEDLSELTSGDLVEVELIVDSKNDYEYLLFIDPKAAGFEPVDLRSGYNGNSMGAYVEFRDDRVCFFVGTLSQGKHSVSYRLRAEIPGRFSALPARAEAMYAPELQGNSDEFKIQVRDRDRTPSEVK